MVRISAETKEEVNSCFEFMVYVMEEFPRYQSSKSHWEQHYKAANDLLAAYKKNIDEMSLDPTTPQFLNKLYQYIEKLEIYRDYKMLIND